MRIQFFLKISSVIALVSAFVVPAIAQYNTTINSPVLWNPSPSSANFSEALLNSKFNLSTSNGQGSAISIMSNNWALGGGYGLLNGDNLVSPMVWMYSGSNNAFTVSRMNFSSSPWNVVGDYLTPLFQVRQDGNVGIGTTSPASKLVVSDGTTAISFSPNSGASALGFNRNAFDGTIFNPSISAWQFSSRDDRFTLEGYNGPSHDLLTVLKNGNVGIGTTTPGSFKLAVNGKIWSQEVNVAMTNPGPDYVFEKSYNLLPLSQLETYINQNKHLPEVPSAKEMEENGLNLKEMNLILLRKIEELTLHVIDQSKLINELQKERSASPAVSGKKVEELTLHLIEANKRIDRLQEQINNSSKN
jgi:hypothetical protein